jgi:hypothetical protein
MGVRGFLYFDFSFGKAGSKTYPAGSAIAREHGNPNMANNQEYVFTWRKDLAKQLCQKCSDSAGHPVKLSLSPIAQRKRASS